MAVWRVVPRTALYVRNDHSTGASSWDFGVRVGYKRLLLEGESAKGEVARRGGPRGSPGSRGPVYDRTTEREHLVSVRHVKDLELKDTRWRATRIDDLVSHVRRAFRRRR